jgi:hypothetical protein
MSFLDCIQESGAAFLACFVPIKEVLALVLGGSRFGGVSDLFRLVMAVLTLDVVALLMLETTSWDLFT